MIFNSRTKIVATIGPASSSEEMLAKLIHAGVDVFRVNFSHGSHEQHLTSINAIKKVRAELNANIGMLADLQGPKIRLGLVENNEIWLEKGEKITITTQECLGTAQKVYLTYKDFPKDVKIGELILCDDGKIQLMALETDFDSNVLCEVVVGGVLSSKKGVNLPNTKVSIPSLTEKDLFDLDFILKHEIEWVGLSFVRSEADIHELKAIINSKNSFTKVIAKIEKPEAVKDIDAIIMATDGVMVARGDLGVEMPLYKLPIIQKQIIKKCMSHAKPVIVATQMMESMINSPTPTRAEVSDVANSVMDGADAVMLSGETSVGQYPVEVIQQMQNIINEVESTNYNYNRKVEKLVADPSSERYVSDAILYCAAKLASGTQAKATIGITQTGYASMKIASYRPKAYTFAFTSNRKIINQLSLIWGVTAFYYDKNVTTDETIADLKQELKKQELVATGDLVVHVSSIPVAERGHTNMLKLNIVD